MLYKGERNGYLKNLKAYSTRYVAHLDMTHRMYYINDASKKSPTPAQQSDIKTVAYCGRAGEGKKKPGPQGRCESLLCSLCTCFLTRTCAHILSPTRY